MNELLYVSFLLCMGTNIRTTKCLFMGNILHSTRCLFMGKNIHSTRCLFMGTNIRSTRCYLLVKIYVPLGVSTTFKLKIFNYLILTLLPIIKLSPIFITIYYH